MTGREKNLILLAFILGAGALTLQFAIRPMYATLSAMEAEYETLSAEAETARLKIGNEAAIRESRDRAALAAEEVSSRYRELMPNEEIDRMLTSLCRENGMTPVSLKIGEAAEVETAVLEDAGGESEAAGSGSEDGEASQDAAEPAQGVFVSVTADMGLNGSFAAVKNLISAVEAADGIRITRLNCGTGGSSPLSVSAVFEITMLNTANTPE